MKGFVHSIESFGSVDGPGIRFLIFLQGCLKYCQFGASSPKLAMPTRGRVVPEFKLIQAEIDVRKFDPPIGE